MQKRVGLVFYCVSVWAVNIGWVYRRDSNGIPQIADHKPIWNTLYHGASKIILYLCITPAVCDILYVCFSEMTCKYDIANHVWAGFRHNTESFTWISALLSFIAYLHNAFSIGTPYTKSTIWDIAGSFLKPWIIWISGWASMSVHKFPLTEVITYVYPWMA